jgi:hypothetical protein
MTIIKTLTEDYAYEDDLPVQYDGILEVETNKLYQVMTQMNAQGQVGFGFLRMDNGLMPIEGKLPFNAKNIIYMGKALEGTQFTRFFEESKQKESARKSGIIL